MEGLGVFRSTEIGTFAGALAKAQGEMAVPAKNRTATVRMREEKGGGTYTYKYADLSDIRAAVTPALSKNELAVSQLLDADKVRLTTLVLHVSGQYLGCTYDLPKGLTAQAFGSALTYARRYSFCAILGIVAEEDDDAQVVQPYTQRQQRVARSGVSKDVKQAAQPQSGTTRPVLPAVPRDWTRERIMQRTADFYPILTKLQPGLDIAAELYGRYGATKRTDLQDEEAWDFLCWMEKEIKAKGVQGVQV